MYKIKLSAKFNLIFNKVVIDDELINLLKTIKESGSLILAAKKTNVSYRYAWNRLNEAGKALGVPLVITIRGGKSGGWTELTITGEELLRKYELFISHSSRKVHKVFRKYIINNDISITGSHCPGVELALKIMATENPELRFHVENVGSLNGLMAVERGKADIAGIHLLDPETETYNEPYIRKFNIKNVILMKGYIREQGLIVRRGNPKKITSIIDIINGKGIFVYRNIGSGTRILFDFLLRKAADQLQITFDEAKQRIKSFPREVCSHSEVAQAILKGYADVGLGIKTVADKYGLDFIPLAMEEYDFVININSIKKHVVKNFTSLISSLRFKNIVTESLTGIKITKDTGKIITTD